MPFKYLKKIIQNIQQLDLQVNHYKAIAKTPEMPSIAYVNWGMYLAQLGEVEAAESKILSSTMMVHKTPESFVALGVIKSKERKFDEAMDCFQNALKLDSENVKAYCFLGNVLTEIKKYNEAEDNFKIALKLSPNNSDVLLNYGISLIRQKRFEEAKEKFNKSCKYASQNATAIYFLGLIDIENNDFDSAEENFQTLINAIPTHNEALYYLAYINYKKEIFDKSLYFALKSLDEYTKKPETYMLISENYMHLEDYENCEKYYKLGEEKSKTTYFYYISWAISLEHFKLYKEAQEKAEKAINMNLREELGYVTLANIFYKDQEYDKSKKATLKALEINDKNPSAIENMGLLLYKEKNYHEAIKYFKNVIELSAKMTDNYPRIAQCYEDLGEISSAEAYYKKSMEYLPQEIWVHIMYSKFLINKKEYESAIKILQKSLKQEPKNIECLNLIFITHYMLAKDKVSDYNMEKAIDIANSIEKDFPEEAFLYKREAIELKKQKDKKMEK